VKHDIQLQILQIQAVESRELMKKIEENVDTRRGESERKHLGVITGPIQELKVGRSLSFTRIWLLGDT